MEDLIFIHLFKFNLLDIFRNFFNKVRNAEAAAHLWVTASGNGLNYSKSGTLPKIFFSMFCNAFSMFFNATYSLRGHS